MSADFDLRAALICARVFVSLHHPRPAPRWALQHLAHLEQAAGCGIATEPVAAVENSALSTTDAATMIGCSPQYVRRIAEVLDGRKIGGRWLFAREEVVAYVLARNP